MRSSIHRDRCLGLVRRCPVGHHVGEWSGARHRSVRLWSCARRMHCMMRCPRERYGTSHRRMGGSRHSMMIRVSTRMTPCSTIMHRTETDRWGLGLTRSGRKGVGRLNRRNRRRSRSRAWKRWPSVHHHWIHRTCHGRIGRQQMRLEGVRYVQDVRRHFCIRFNQIHGCRWGARGGWQCVSRCLRSCRLTRRNGSEGRRGRRFQVFLR